jgi:NTE family protein
MGERTDDHGAGPHAEAIRDLTPLDARNEFPCEHGGHEEYGLALSGGGIRATLFHLGALLRINQLGKLREIDRISSVSGGSIAAGLLAVAWPDLTWEGGRATNLRERFAMQVMRLAKMPLDVPIVALGLVPGINPANVLAQVLDRFFFEDRTLQDLPDRADGPRFVFNATELATGTDFRFSKAYLGSYLLGVVCDPKVRLADAVAASASFPPFVSPLVLRFDPAEFRWVSGARLFNRKDLLSQIALLDGGAYDNCALEPITDRCHTYLVSDAGGNLNVDGARWEWGLWSRQLKRTLDIAVAQARAQRRHALFPRRPMVPPGADAAAPEHPVAFWRTLTDPSKYTKPTPFAVAQGWPEYLSALPTRLWPFSVADRHWLVNWGYLTADLALRNFVWTDADPPQRLPFPNATFVEPPPVRRGIGG